MEKLGLFLTALFTTLIVVLIAALPTMWAWDSIMPEYFGVKEITFVDALWVNVFAACVFKSSSK